MKLTKSERIYIETVLKEYKEAPIVLEMKRFVQHGAISTYDHCDRVAKLSFWMSRRLQLHSDETALLVGAFLHDFYLYDWHTDNPFGKKHGFYHPGIAAKNAEMYFRIGEKEKIIIERHMWPFNFRKMPNCREAVLVCVADKICSAEETLFKRT